ncbi:MAG: diguanylate cyclase [Methylomonas sp.]|jgi:diguanylate cyclase|uniref:GGDEF domain-containing protein n=1 Tax=Methylomonas sp. TaxID=418 RepID=UPI0025D3FD21|nr:GGDEF domain-containing protein [Methylomonas sp.]MCK9606508.1 diguanylate cyclase [Methylomonas sp.]
MDHSAALLPVYDFSFALNSDYLKKIIPLLTQHQIAANPVNYAIFYDYVTELNPSLTSAVNQLLSRNISFDHETSLELYGNFISNASLRSFDNINQQIHKVIRQATDAINDTCHKAEQTNDSFQKKSAILENTPEIATTQSILQEIIQETKSLAATSQAMQIQLNKANVEMEQLRAELAQVRQIAVTDGLTGLLNRRAFDQTLSEIIEQPGKATTCLSLLDIDHFKRVNDTYGHTIGDNVIKFVATLMKKHAEDHHHVARYGGEELAIIMPNTPKQKAIEIAENIRLEMEKSRLKRKTDNLTLGRITISVGIAELLANDDPESFVTRADTALYQAKETGRNKVMH